MNRDAFREARFRADTAICFKYDNMNTVDEDYERYDSKT